MVLTKVALARFAVARSSLNRFAADRRGAAAVWIAVAAPAMVMTSAAGVQVSQWMLARTELQRAADIAAQAGGLEYGSTGNAQGAATIAASLAEINGVTGAATRSWSNAAATLSDNLVSVRVGSGPVNSAHTGIYVTVSRPITNTFPIPGATTAHVETATSVVEVWKSPPNACLLALDKTADSAIKVDNMGSLVATGCGIQANSNSGTAIYLNSGKISGTAVSAVGGIVTSNSGSNTLSPSPGSSGVMPAKDPFGSLTPPTPGACTVTNGNYTSYSPSPYAFAPKDANTPMVFCGNTTIGGNGTTDTFAAGIYYVVNGNLIFNNANVTQASSVTFVLTGSNPGSVQWTNYSNTVQMTAPRTGSTAGIVFWQTCPASGSAPANTMTGGSTLNLAGAFYAPCGALQVSGNMNLGTVSGQSMSVVADTIYASGSASINATTTASSTGAAVNVNLVQ